MPKRARRRSSAEVIARLRAAVARLALPSASLAAWLALAPAARATIIDFALSGVIFTYGNSNTVSMAGTFNWDTSTQAAVSSTLTISGDTSSVNINGSYSTPYGIGPNSIHVQDAGGIYIDLNFAQSLSSVSPGGTDALVGGYVRDNAGGSGNANCGYCIFASSTGSAVNQNSPIPEPSSLALLAAGVGRFRPRHRTAGRHGGRPMLRVLAAQCRNAAVSLQFSRSPFKRLDASGNL